MKNLTKKLIFGGAVVLSSIFGFKDADGQVKINPFVQPNDSTLNWYGSGDANNDGKVDSKDIGRLDSVISKKFSDKKDKRLYDRADVNGEGKVDSTDKKTLDDYLNKIINYLPGQWNKLATRAEREDWLNKMLAIDKTDTLKGIPGVWISGDFAAQTYINFHGHQGVLSSEYDPTNNGRFNLSLHDVRITNPLHGANAILVGDSLNRDPRLWENWYFLEPQDDTEIEIGKWNLKKDSNVEISKIKEFAKTGGYWPNTFLIFSIDKNGVPSLLSYDPNLQLTRDTDTPVEEEKQENFVVREFVLKQNYPNPFNGETKIKYIISKPGKIDLDIYDIKGQKIRDLVEEFRNQGEYQAIWDGKNNSNVPVASGIYPYVLRKDGKYVKGKKMMLIK